MSLPVESSGYHWTYGWLRRAEMDNEDGYCYEAPDGDLLYSRCPEHAEKMTLYELVDNETGDHYLVDTIEVFR